MEDRFKALSYEELENLIEEILTGTRVYRDRDLGKVFLFRQPTLKLQRKARLLYDHFYEEAHQAGLLTIEEMDEILEKRGIFTDLDRREIELIEKKIQAQREILKRTFRVPANRKRLLDIIKNLEAEKSLIEEKRLEHLRHTCESKAAERKMVYVLVNCVLDFESELPIWSGVEEFEKWRDIEAKSRLVLEFMKFLGGNDIHIIRQIARSGQWRVRYLIAKNTSADLFGKKAVFEFSPDQINLMYWTEFYNNIYEMMPEDRPTDDIIDDDASLDAYMEEYLKERNREVMSFKGSRNTMGRQNAFSHNQVIVTRSNPLYQDIEYSPIPESLKKREGTSIKELDEQRQKGKKRIGSLPDR